MVVGGAPKFIGHHPWGGPLEYLRAAHAAGHRLKRPDEYLYARHHGPGSDSLGLLQQHRNPAISRRHGRDAAEIARSVGASGSAAPGGSRNDRDVHGRGPAHSDLPPLGAPSARVAAR